jgi:alpha-tubulin suppressor-like RCC1 family protein
MVDTCSDIKSNVVPCALAPIAVPDLFVRFVSAGRVHTCAILSDARVLCWGDTSSGLLGDGTGIPSSAPVAATGLGAAAVVSTGKEHTCAVLVDGSAWCWGEGSSSGQLGTGVCADSLEPVRVSVPGALRSVDLEQSADHTCAVDVDDQIWCWGSNDYGQLGSMATTDSATPLLVTLPP